MITFNRAASTERPKNLLAWVTVFILDNNQERWRTYIVQKVGFKGEIIWCLILVNQYHNSPPRFPGQKEGQCFQTEHPIAYLGGCFINDWINISLIIWRKGIPEIRLPLPVKIWNHYLKGGKHLIPIFSNNILLHISGLSEQLRREQQTLKSQNITAYFPMWFSQRSCLSAIYKPRKSLRGSSFWAIQKNDLDKLQYGMWRACKYSHFSICSIVDLPQRLGRRTRSTLPFRPSLMMFSISLVLSTRKRPSWLRSWGKKGEHMDLSTPPL